MPAGGTKPDPWAELKNFADEVAAANPSEETQQVLGRWEAFITSAGNIGDVVEEEFPAE